MKLVEEAIKGGINYIDTAPWYGQGRSEQVGGSRSDCGFIMDIRAARSRRVCGLII